MRICCKLEGVSGPQKSGSHLSTHRNLVPLDLIFDASDHLIHQRRKGLLDLEAAWKLVSAPSTSK